MIYVMISKRFFVTESLEENELTLKFRSETIEHLRNLFLSSRAHDKIISLLLSETLINEFEMVSKVTMNLSLEYHYRCYCLFQENELKEIFGYTYSLLDKLCKEIEMLDSNNNETVFLLKVCLTVSTRILSWPFAYWDDILEFQSEIETYNTMKPIASWYSILGNIDIISTFSLTCTYFRQKEEYYALARECLSQICAINSDNILSNDNILKSQWVDFLASTLNNLLNLHDLTHQEYWFYSQMAYRFFLNNRSFLSSETVKNGDGKKFFDTLFMNTKRAIEQMNVSNDDSDSSYITQSIDNWINLWVLLTSESIKLRISFIQPFAFEVFKLYTEVRLESNGINFFRKHREDNKYIHSPELIEQLENIGLIGRLAPKKSSEFLIHLLRTHIENLKYEFSQNYNKNEIEKHFNHLYWLISITVTFLADDIRGEIPTIPHTFIALSHYADENNIENPIVVLTNLIFSIAEFENLVLQESKENIWPPSLSETLMWFFARWSQTYLMLPEFSIMNKGKSLLQAFSSESESALNLLDFLIQKIHFNIIYWKSNFHVLNSTCNLILTLSKLNISLEIVNKLKSWNYLLQSYLDGFIFNELYEPSIQRIFVKSMLQFNFGETREDRQNYNIYISKPVIERISELINAIHSNIEIDESIIICNLERFRGILQATKISNTNLTNELFHQYADNFILILGKFKHHSCIMSIFRLFKDFITNVLIMLDEEAITPFVHKCQALFEDYIKLLETSSRFQFTDRDNNNEIVEFSKEVYYYLKILDETSSKSDSDLSKNIYYCLSLILPYINNELLQFPNVISKYFDLISTLLERGVKFINEMNDDFFYNLISSLQYGIDYHDDSIQMRALEGIYFIASFKFNSELNGIKILNEKKEQYLINLMNHFIKWIILMPFSINLISYMSNSFLALILCNIENYQLIVENILAENSEASHRLNEIFNNLQLGIDRSLDNDNKLKFLENMKIFIANIRGILNKV